MATEQDTTNVENPANTAYQAGLDALNAKKYDVAAQAFEDALLKGHPGAAIRLHWLYSGKNGLTSKNNHSLHRLETSSVFPLPVDTINKLEEKAGSSKENDKESQFTLAWCYQHGLGLNIDLSKAAEYFWKAASQEHKDVQHYLDACRKQAATQYPHAHHLLSYFHEKEIEKLKQSLNMKEKQLKEKEESLKKKETELREQTGHLEKEKQKNLELTRIILDENKSAEEQLKKTIGELKKKEAELKEQTGHLKKEKQKNLELTQSLQKVQELSEKQKRHESSNEFAVRHLTQQLVQLNTENDALKQALHDQSIPMGNNNNMLQPMAWQLQQPTPFGPSGNNNNSSNNFPLQPMAWQQQNPLHQSPSPFWNNPQGQPTSWQPQQQNVPSNASLPAHIIRGNLNEVGRQLDFNNAKSALNQGMNGKDLSGNPLNNITPLAYAYWALDIEMVELISRHMDPAQALGQINEFEQNHAKYGFPEVHFNSNEIKSALDEYTIYFNTLQSRLNNLTPVETEKLQKLWREGVGGAQRKFPAWLIYGMCETGNTSTWSSNPGQVGKRRDYNKLDTWFRPNSDEVLGKIFAYQKGEPGVFPQIEGGTSLKFKQTPFFALQTIGWDKKACIESCKIRTEAVRNFKNQLMQKAMGQQQPSWMMGPSGGH
jgi:hypothetical protein